MFALRRSAATALRTAPLRRANTVSQSVRHATPGCGCPGCLAARNFSSLAARALVVSSSAKPLSQSQPRIVSRGFGSDSASHPDFAPQTKAPELREDVRELFQAEIAANPVFLYLKGTPAAPRCGFSRQVVTILDSMGLDYGFRNVLSDPEIREGIKAFSNWPTIPQLYVRGELVGGCDIVSQMFMDGELQQLLKDEIAEAERRAEEEEAQEAAGARQ